MNDPKRHPQSPPANIAVLGTPLTATSYDGLIEHCLAWAELPGVVALDFANTQTVTMCRHDPAFRSAYLCFDYVVPDGMPLVWCMNRAGAMMSDRVYGPTFMKRFLDCSPREASHYLLGGSSVCGERIREIFSGSNPDVRFVGSFHGRCSADGALDSADEAAVFDEIDSLQPDFIWIGFGTPKQQAWVERYKRRIRRGVILTVGFGFDVNAGLKPDPPLWMQRAGLGWVFRLASEPRRLLGRYLKYNSLFLGYLVIDGLRGSAWSAETPNRRV